MDRLVARGSPGDGWFAFTGPRSSHELAATIAASAKARGLSVETAPAGGSARVTVAYPEGEATIDLFDVEGDARTRLAICRRGAEDAVAQARALLRETLDRDGGIDAMLACDAVSWKSLPELAPHRRAVARSTASNVVAGLARVVLVPDLLLIAFFGYGVLATHRRSCGPDVIDAPGEMLRVGLFGLALFALTFGPGVLLLRRSRRTLGRSVGALTFFLLALVVALFDVLLVVSVDVMC